MSDLSRNVIRDIVRSVSLDIWEPQPTHADVLLLESGDRFLLESGDNLLLE